MPVNITNVLVCDAVDDACVALLKQNGINVCKIHTPFYLNNNFIGVYFVVNLLIINYRCCSLMSRTIP